MKDKLNCWEFNKCGMDKTKGCPVVQKGLGRYCWVITGTLCVGATPNCTFLERFGNCLKCEYFKYLHEE
jgi:hypothetical protein